MKYTKEEARVKKQALTSLQVRAIPPVVKTTGISPTMSMKLHEKELATLEYTKHEKMTIKELYNNLLKQSKII